MIAAKKIRKVKTVIGRSDKVDLPVLDLYDIEAKVDSGAYTSAIHCSDIKEIEENGRMCLQFILLDKTHPAYNRKKFIIKEYTRRNIRNSFGHAEKRYIIRTTVVMFGRQFETEFSLSDRGALKFPVLLGRKFLQKGFIVNVNKYNLSYKRKLKKAQDENSSIVEKPLTILNQETSRGRQEKRTPGEGNRSSQMQYRNREAEARYTL